MFKYHLESCSFLEIFIFVFVFADRSALKIREEDFTYPPIQVVVEVAVSLLLFLWAALKVPGSFLPILPDAEANRVTMLCANLDFMTFNHRGKLFEPEVGEAKFS